MRDIIKNLIFQTFRILGVYRFYRRKVRDKAVVLTYHGILPEIPRVNGSDFEYRNFVTAKQFEDQIRFLLKHYRPLKVADFYEENNTVAGGFLITFDDGFRNNYRYAMPVLQKYNLQGCFFISTDLIGTRQYLWTEQVTLLLEKTTKSQLELTLDSNKRFEIATPEQKEAASLEIRRHMKRMPLQQRNAVLAQLKEQLSDVALEVGSQEEERYLFMTWEEVRAMIEGGQAIGGHTHTHPILSTLTEEESQQELELSRTAIETHTGQPCLSMSYPNGEKEDYSDIQISQLQKLGYQCAFTQVPLFNSADTNRFELRRVNVSLKLPLAMLEAKLCGFIK